VPLLDKQTIDEEWSAALADADLGDDHCRCLLFLLEAVDAGGPTSGHYPPDRKLGADELITEEMAERLNKPDSRDKHRVVVLRDVRAGEHGRALFAAKIRHELEHARQWDGLGDVPQRLSCLVEVIDVVAGGFNDRGRAIYRAQPVEQDANAAASIFVRGRFSQEAVEAILNSDDDVLAASELPPEPLETLPRRMVASLFQYRDICATLTDDGLTFAGRLERISTNALQVWTELERERQNATPGP
jgi:hypothetical protein